MRADAADDARWPAGGGTRRFDVAQIYTPVLLAAVTHCFIFSSILRYATGFARYFFPYYEPRG